VYLLVIGSAPPNSLKILLVAWAELCENRCQNVTEIDHGKSSKNIQKIGSKLEPETPKNQENRRHVRCQNALHGALSAPLVSN